MWHFLWHTPPDMCEAETTLVATSSRSVNTSVWPSQQEGRSLKQQQTNRTFVAATGFRVVTSPPASPPHPHPSHTILALSKHQILLYFCFNHLSFRCTILDFFFFTCEALAEHTRDYSFLLKIWLHSRTWSASILSTFIMTKENANCQLNMLQPKEKRGVGGIIKKGRLYDTRVKVTTFLPCNTFYCSFTFYSRAANENNRF